MPTLMIAWYVCRWNGVVLEFTLPQELANMLLLFMKKGHAIACPDQQVIFTKATGQPMTKASHLSQYWDRLLLKIGCQVKINPHL